MQADMLVKSRRATSKRQLSALALRAKKSLTDYSALQSTLLMAPQISPQEAGALLADVESARAAMRHAIRAHRGHFHLWIWGVAWTIMPLLAYFRGDDAARFFPFICVAGGVLSIIVGFTQQRQIRRPPNGRFAAVMITVWLFAALFPFVLHVPFNPRTLYAYCCLVAMQTYVIAGLWTDSYLLWVGITVTALILAGVYFFPAIFWLWMAVFGGGSLVLTGFYVRHFWR
jgi:hypothetical protein